MTLSTAGLMSQYMVVLCFMNSFECESAFLMLSCNVRQ